MSYEDKETTVGLSILLWATDSPFAMTILVLLLLLLWGPTLTICSKPVGEEPPITGDLDVGDRPSTLGLREPEWRISWYDNDGE